MSQETLAQVGMADSGVALPPASQAIVEPERGFAENHTQQNQSMNWQLPEQTEDGNRQLLSSDWLMENSEWLLLNGFLHLSDDERQPLPVGGRDFYPSARSQPAGPEARNMPGNHDNHRRPLITWPTPKEDYPQCCRYFTSASAVTHSESKLTKRLESSELPVQFSLTHDLFLPSFGSRSFSTPPVVYSEPGSAQTFQSPLLPTGPESAHYSLAPNVDPLSFLHPVIRLEACSVPEVNFDEPSIPPASSSQPATRHDQNSKNPSGDDASTTVEIHHKVASQNQSLLPGPERDDIDSSEISDSPAKRIDATIPNFLNLQKIDSHEHRKLKIELADVSDLESLEFDRDAFRENGENGGVKKLMRILLIKKIDEGSQNKLRLPPDSRAYADLATLANLGRETHVHRKPFSRRKSERQGYLAAAKDAFLTEKAVWSLHWLIHKGIDVQIYLRRLEDHKFVRMEGTFYLFLYYVEMIIAIVPRAQNDGGPINEASELASACGLFVEFTKTLQSQADPVGKHCDPELAEMIRFFKRHQIIGQSMQYYSIIWHFLQEWIRRNRRNIIRSDRTDVGFNVKSFFNDVFYLTVRNLNKRYRPLLAFRNKIDHLN